MNPSLERAMSIQGLTKDDLTIPVNFDDEMAVRSGFRLILPLVKDLMLDPTKCFSLPDTLLRMSALPVDSFMRELYQMIDFHAKVSKPSPLVSFGAEIPDALTNYYSQKAAKNEFESYLKDEKKFLKEKVLAVMSDAEDIKTDNSDIFAYNRARDSSLAVSKRVVELLNKSDKRELFQKSFDHFLFLFQIYSDAKAGKFKPMIDDEYYSDESDVDGNIIYYYDEGGLRIAIGSDTPNRYEGYFDLIIDLGGNDVYELSPSPHGYTKTPQCIIDLSGNDLYESTKDFALASAFFGSSFIFDSEGDDVYKGAGTSVASAVCGLGVIVDEKGNDIYRGVNHSIGAATFGAGALIDNEGNDTYIANSSSQGFGSTGGIGVIRDNKGNDSYMVDSRSLDLGRYEDHYISMCQGYGNGVRPYYAGGIGLIIESEGNDIYNTDIFGQGGAYWFALGCIADKAGNDKYNSYQYGQGAGIHLAVGVLKDYDGWDFYSSNGVSQGCGHDYGFGLLQDVKGNDNYSAYSLSQGAGNANGIGIILDEAGRDGYLNKEPGNTRGYGNSRREYGSIGIFADASGEDFYSLPGFDSTYSLGSMWGSFIDDTAMPESVGGSASAGYKVQVDSSRSYTNEEFLIMAKTIEPRFSLWKDFGFRKLAEDSLATSEFILKYLDTDDHRTALVLRDLAFRIGYSMGDVFSQKLNHYQTAASVSRPLSTEQVSFICYLFGETGNPVGKDQLLQLTYSESKRIKGSAVNAIGKLKIEESDRDFKESVAGRLRELAVEEDAGRMLRKDVAYAFKKYQSDQNIPVLMNMLSDKYFAPRLLAADCLSSMGENYYSALNDEYIQNIPTETPADIAFLRSLAKADDEFMLKYLSQIDLGDKSPAYMTALADFINSKSDSEINLRNNSVVIELLNEITKNTNLRQFRNDK
jgi:hypothetical protein